MHKFTLFFLLLPVTGYQHVFYDFVAIDSINGRLNVCHNSLS